MIFCWFWGTARHFVTPGKDAKGNFTDGPCWKPFKRIRTAKKTVWRRCICRCWRQNGAGKALAPGGNAFGEKSQRLVELNAELDMDAAKMPGGNARKEENSGPEL